MIVNYLLLYTADVNKNIVCVSNIAVGKTFSIRYALKLRTVANGKSSKTHIFQRGYFRAEW